jgi:hypothetical protein
VNGELLLQRLLHERPLWPNERDLDGHASSRLMTDGF